MSLNSSVYHTGIYKYFEYLANGNGKISYAEMDWATFGGNSSLNILVFSYYKYTKYCCHKSNLAQPSYKVT